MGLFHVWMVCRAFTTKNMAPTIKSAPPPPSFNINYTPTTNGPLGGLYFVASVSKLVGCPSPPCPLYADKPVVNTVKKENNE